MPSRQATIFDLLEPERQPAWDDVRKGLAHLEDRVEPCDRCGLFGFDAEGRCLNVPERYAHPCNRGDGTCRKHYIVWNEEQEWTSTSR